MRVVFFLLCFGVVKGLPPPIAQVTNTSEIIDDTDMYLEPDQQPHSTQPAADFKPSPAELVGGSQTFFPSFLYNNQPLGHSRPLVFQQEAAYSQRPAGAYRQQQLYNENLKYNNPFRRENYQTAESSQSVLGSGNFGVIRGGTFYNENDQQEVEPYQNGRYNNYNQYFHNNGHGRPAFFFGGTNPKPHEHEQFANFRDFADININTPTPAYSQYVVVYINKNGSKVETPKKQPKNIIERLAMIDLEVKKGKDSYPEKKISATKRKLAIVPLEKKQKNIKTSTTPPTTDLYEPLLALS